MCFYFLIAMSLELRRRGGRETFRHENHLAGSQSCAQSSPDFPDPTFGVQGFAGEQVSVQQPPTGCPAELSSSDVLLQLYGTAFCRDSK